MDTRFPERPRRPLRDDVRDIDRDILRLLLRRHNLLLRMRNKKGFLEPSEERFLRTSWQRAAAAVSSDNRLSVHFFALMQELEFLPRPVEAADEDRPSPARPGFNLAPAPKAVCLNMPGPLACRPTRALLFLAAQTGAPLSLTPCLMNDPILACVRLLNQIGARVEREGETVTIRESAPLDAPDKDLHVGGNAWNFYLALAHYLYTPSRVKFSGESALKLADISAIRHFLPTLGARLAHVIPKSNGLPARLECSGDVPDAVTLPENVPPELGEAMLLTAHARRRALTLDVSGHPFEKPLQSRIMPLLTMTGADVAAESGRIRLKAGEARFPQKIALPVEPELVLFLAALPLALGGETLIDGFWPSSWPHVLASLRLLEQAGLELRETDGRISARASPLKTFRLEAIPLDFPAEWLPLPLSLAACAALRSGEATVSPLSALADDDVKEYMDGFFEAVGLAVYEDGSLRKKEQGTAFWNAPAPVWALAYALTACARPHLRLGNPDILSGLYPGFWTLYNSLPNPKPKKTDLAADAPETAARRRVLSSASARIPQMKSGEYPPDAPAECEALAMRQTVPEPQNDEA
ncbi:MAG: 3-phosphoshikimate 1-carboxyvinyltransferase [Desulfovibrio sp.]|jgi:5-enolpyruvylshikimate-3-phosphate synthase|nr:3-phosphoshikimate 1-carboxyvinyltransferase [Desulfovibrio sp.]